MEEPQVRIQFLAEPKTWAKIELCDFFLHFAIYLEKKDICWVLFVTDRFEKTKLCTFSFFFSFSHNIQNILQLKNPFFLKTSHAAVFFFEMGCVGDPYSIQRVDKETLKIRLEFSLFKMSPSNPNPPYISCRCASLMMIVSQHTNENDFLMLNCESGTLGSVSLKSKV